ncbi:unnamed protein product [Clonostachys rhizophaga]|uniref:Uncharacterized protein n=1 Tax=Clonostachys rhizophaga TaxID=160324 RepID=A0A9N9V5H7_9HYPO|nr:unnamed protein product [Clonostachys rhizophaga]
MGRSYADYAKSMGKNELATLIKLMTDNAIVTIEASQGEEKSPFRLTVIGLGRGHGGLYPVTANINVDVDPSSRRPVEA